jgi:protease stability complex PrcB-like protein
MNSRMCAAIALTALAGCAGATTMRVAQGDSTEESATSLAPAPETAADTVTRDSSATRDPTTSTQIPSQPAEQGYAGYDSQVALEVRRIGQWTRTGISESRRLIIRDANAWAAFWSELGMGQRPAVDFTKDMVVAVAAGQRPSGGYEIQVHQVTQQGGELTVEVLETAPGPNCMTSASLTQPVDVVVLPSVNLRSWSFLERQEVRGCR